MPTFNAGSRKFYGVVERDDLVRAVFLGGAAT